MKVRDYLPAAAALALACSGAGAQGTATLKVTGTVTNGTLGRPAGGERVTLVELNGSMQPVGGSTADADGKYSVTAQTQAGAQYMVQVLHDGISYFQQLQGSDHADLTVFDASADASKIGVDAEILVVQPERGQLAVVDEFRIENRTQPPRALTAEGGLFRFRIPAGAKLDSARAVPPGGLPITADTAATSDASVYRLDYPLRPGETAVQAAYRLPYGALKAEIKAQPIYPTAQFEVYLPTPMSLQGSGFTKVGTQEGYNIFGLDSSAGAALVFSVAGDAPMPSPAVGGDTPGQASVQAPAGGMPAADQAAPAASGEAAPPAKTFMEQNSWIVLALLGIAAIAGFSILFASYKPASVPAGGGGAVGTLPASSATTATAATSGSGDEALKRLKDDLFLLEVRRHTGNIEPAEYDRLRSEIEARMDRLAGR